MASRKTGKNHQRGEARSVLTPQMYEQEAVADLPLSAKKEGNQKTAKEKTKKCAQNCPQGNA